MIDTHTHLYEENFDQDRIEMIQRAFDAGIKNLLIPNVDAATIEPMMAICKSYPNQIFPMLGLHPCYVKQETYKTELALIYNKIKDSNPIAIGEIGIDLYWDKTTLEIQKEAFETQCDWALEHQLPIAIHSRDSTHVILDILKKRKQNPSGVFHCFTGSFEEAKEIIKLGFSLGIGGVVTYKNTHLRDTLSKIELQHIVLETDAPYLPPVPYRGKRNESAYTLLVAETLATVYQRPLEEIAQQTTQNAKNLFKLN
ncbi:MAG: TatD family hydrolase [Bacteroidetes bacterium]|nr:TatD family hydrolase [Bacteroidota bacterium]